MSEIQIIDVISRIETSGSYCDTCQRKFSPLHVRQTSCIGCTNKHNKWCIKHNRLESKKVYLNVKVIDGELVFSPIKN